jgi:hypothetical protein
VTEGLKRLGASVPIGPGMSVLAEAVPATLVSSLAYPFDIVDAPGSSGWAASSSSLDKTISATISGKAPRPQETKVLVSESDTIRSHARSYLRRRVLTVEQNRTSLGRSVSSVSNNSLTIAATSVVDRIDQGSKDVMS